MNIADIENKIINAEKEQKNYKTVQINKEQKRYHRVVMERFLGRKLKEDEIVHHIDGNKNNNVISNLKIVTRAEHLKIHYKEIGGVENQYKQKFFIDKNVLKKQYQNPFMTHKKLAEMYGCSTGTIARLLGKKARKDIECCRCSRKAKYIKKRLCEKCYRKEWENENRR